MAGLRALGWSVTVRELGPGFPFPSAAERAGAARVLAGAQTGSRVVVDGLALGVLGDVAAAATDRLALIALVHHPLALETGLDPADARAFARTEKRALALARRTIATSATTARVLVDRFAVAPARLGVVRPGTDRRAPRPPRVDGPPRLLCVGSLTPRKGQDVLLSALDRLRDLPWEATLLGAARDAGFARAVRRAAEAPGLAGRVHLAGEVGDDALARAYGEADLLVLPSRYEGFGMVLTEAVASGLPIVASEAGAIPEAAPPEARMLVPPDDPGALAAALRRLLTDPRALTALAAGADRAAPTLPTWEHAACRFAEEVRKVGPETVDDQTRAGRSVPSSRSETS